MPRQPRSRRASILRLILAAAAAVVTLLVLSYLAIGAYIATEATQPRRNTVLRSPDTLRLSYESVSFPSAEGGIELKGWFLPSSGNQPIVMVHGLDANRSITNGRSLEVAKTLVDDGHPVLMFDLRGHGESGGERLGMAWKERADVLGALTYLKGRGFGSARFGIHGTSYGAATSLNATGLLPEVGAVIADSSFYDFREVLSGEITRRTGLPPIFAPAITVFADLLYGLNLNQIQPFQHLAEIAPRPVFYIHQEGDPRIRADHSIRLKAAGANPADELWIVPGITHARAFEQEPAAYAERMLRFFRDHLK
ncbi:MAG: alpha/beta fold hydrolase [Dehalococcoidia bacterium]